MRLAHLQQQLSEIRESSNTKWGNESFHHEIVMLHSHISGAAEQCTGQSGRCPQELAALVIKLVDFPAMFPDWGDIWGSQRLEDFGVDKLSGDIWDHLYKLHQLASGLVGGRSDIILLYKMIQIARAAAQIQEVDLPRAIKEQMDRYWQTSQVT